MGGILTGTGHSLTRRVRTGLFPLARRLPRGLGPGPVRRLSRDARVADAEQLTASDPERALALLEQELTPEAPARLVRAAAGAAYRADDQQRIVELLGPLLVRGETRSGDLLRLAQAARQVGDHDLLDRAQSALLARTPTTAPEVRRVVNALATLDHRHRADLERWHDRVAASVPDVDLTGVDALLAAARASEMALGGPLEAAEVAEVLAAPEGATHLVRRLTRARRFADLATLLPTWSQATLESIPAQAWRWLSRHAASHG